MVCVAVWLLIDCGWKLYGGWRVALFSFCTVDESLRILMAMLGANDHLSV